MTKFKIGDKIMGISTDMLGIRIVYGNIIKVIENKDTNMTRYIVDKGIIGKDSIYDEEAVEYNEWKLNQAKLLYTESEKFETKVKELRDTARTVIYSQGSK